MRGSELLLMDQIWTRYGVGGTERKMFWMRNIPHQESSRKFFGPPTDIIQDKNIWPFWLLEIQIEFMKFVWLLRKKKNYEIYI
jgi:hypothetical protein